MTNEDAYEMRDALERAKWICRCHDGGCENCPAYNEDSMIECKLVDSDEWAFVAPCKWSIA